MCQNYMAVKKEERGEYKELEDVRRGETDLDKCRGCLPQLLSI